MENWKTQIFKVPLAVQEQNDFERNASELTSAAEMCGACCLKQWGALLIDDKHESFGHVTSTVFIARYTTESLHYFKIQAFCMILKATFLDCS